MKRAKNLFSRVCDFENLLLAAQKARRGKRHQNGPLLFHHNIEYELSTIRRELLDRTYTPGPYRQFQIYDTKPRIISAAPYRDRIVHHALCNIIEPIFERAFIFDSYACRKGKGTHAAVDRLTHFMRRHRYILQCDIRRYFPSIDHAILKRLLRRKIGCPDTLWLIDRFIDTVEEPTGLPIGNQTSQFFANVYLNGFDHFIQETLRHHAYVRYVDDFALLADDKRTLWEARDAVSRYLRDELALDLHPVKQSVAPVSEGAPFLGYRVFPDHRLLGRASAVRFARKLQKMQSQYRSRTIGLHKIGCRILAWLGHAGHADTHGLKTKLLGGAVFSRA